MSDGLFIVGIEWLYDEHIFVYPKDKKYYVLPYYSDFKSEIMEYKYIKNIINVYKQEIYKKAML